MKLPTAITATAQRHQTPHRILPFFFQHPIETISSVELHLLIRNEVNIYIFFFAIRFLIQCYFRYTRFHAVSIRSIRHHFVSIEPSILVQRQNASLSAPNKIPLKMLAALGSIEMAQ